MTVVSPNSTGLILPDNTLTQDMTYILNALDDYSIVFNDAANGISLAVAGGTNANAGTIGGTMSSISLNAGSNPPLEGAGLPEPASLTILAAALLGMAGVRRRKTQGRN